MNELRIVEKKEFMGKEIPVIIGGFGEDCKVLTDKMVAEIHGVEPKRIRELINNNLRRFKENIDIIDLKVAEDSLIITDFGYSSQQVKVCKNIYILSERGFAKLITLMDKTKTIGVKFLKEYFGLEQYYPDTCDSRKEIIFLDKLEEVLKAVGIKDFSRQHKVFNYRIDLYIPSLNVSIEYDEDGHKGYSYEEHEVRQKEIEENLKCKFIRVTDFETDEHNIGLVVKEIFNI